MQEIIYKIIYMVLYILATATRAPYAQKAKKMKIKFSKNKVKELILMIPIGIGMMILPLFYVFSNYLNKFNMNLPTEIRIIGIIGFTAAVFIHNWAHITLKTNFSPLLEIKEKQKLITNGPYKYVRHPMYSAFWLWSIFQGILLSNWLVLVAGIISFTLMYSLRIKTKKN